MIIQHRLGHYPVEWNAIDDIIRALPTNHFIVTDETVHRKLGFRLQKGIVLPPGEQNKGLATYQRLLSEMVQAGCNRKTSLVAIGGGVIGDLGGFLAATYMRGIPFIQVPTTLLAQVDSSVGGKVGIDLPEGKNLVGAFYPPVRVDIPREALTTLPPREFANGMAEVLKYGFILDRRFSDSLQENSIGGDEMVARCIQLKAEVVEADEFETNGIRAKLNFGHTVGHAIEQVLGYQTWLHGEAISIGMVVETHLGEQLGITAPGTTKEVARRLEQFHLPTRWDGLHDTEPILRAMARDKKATEGSLAFSLLTEIGECKLIAGISADIVRQSLLTS